MWGLRILGVGLLALGAAVTEARDWDPRGRDDGKSWGHDQRGHGWDDRGGNAVLCESVRGRRNWCAVDTRHGVWLREQYSRADCIEGVSWGYGQRGIWVSDGCRAEFVLGRSRDRYRDDRGVPSGWQGGGWQGQGHGQRAYCESVKGRYQQCPIRGLRDVQLVRVISRSSCDYGRSWGFDRRGIWVDHGCRAEFVVR
ncbi:MAG: DUF3011 domain-containing protein [Xanthomonadales bacterium]|jgi:hypothetical protein|nr:DUF3011 domain-containing protein [Xanthomonadales bacterium]